MKGGFCSANCRWRDKVEKIVSLYAIIVSLITIFGIIVFYSRYPNPGYAFAYAIFSMLGVAGGILLLRGKAEGLFPLMAWAVLQVPILQVNSFFINFQQVFRLDGYFAVSYAGSLVYIGVNFVGLILAGLLLAMRYRAGPTKTARRRRR